MLHATSHHTEIWQKAILKWEPRTGQGPIESETKILGFVDIFLMWRFRRRAINPTLQKAWKAWGWEDCPRIQVFTVFFLAGIQRNILLNESRRLDG